MNSHAEAALSRPSVSRRAVASRSASMGSTSAASPSRPPSVDSGSRPDHAPWASDLPKRARFARNCRRVALSHTRGRERECRGAVRACFGRQPAVAPSAAGCCIAPADNESAGSTQTPRRRRCRSARRSSTVIGRGRRLRGAPGASEASGRPARRGIEATGGGGGSARFLCPQKEPARRSAALLLCSRRGGDLSAGTDAARHCFRTKPVTHQQAAGWLLGRRWDRARAGSKANGIVS